MVLCCFRPPPEQVEEPVRRPRPQPKDASIHKQDAYSVDTPPLSTNSLRTTQEARKRPSLNGKKEPDPGAGKAQSGKVIPVGKPGAAVTGGRPSSSQSVVSPPLPPLHQSSSSLYIKQISQIRRTGTSQALGAERSSGQSDEKSTPTGAAPEPIPITPAQDKTADVAKWLADSPVQPLFEHATDTRANTATYAIGDDDVAQRVSSTRTSEAVRSKGSPA